MNLIFALLLGVLTSLVSSFSTLLHSQRFSHYPSCNNPIHKSLSNVSTNKNVRLIQLNGNANNNDKSENIEDDIGKPIELESMQMEPPTMFGLEKTQEFDALDTGVPLFTGAIIFVFSIYFIVSLLFFDGTDPLSIT